MMARTLLTPLTNASASGAVAPWVNAALNVGAGVLSVGITYMLVQVDSGAKPSLDEAAWAVADRIVYLVVFEALALSMTFGSASNPLLIPLFLVLTAAHYAIYPFAIILVRERLGLREALAESYTRMRGLRLAAFACTMVPAVAGGVLLLGLRHVGPDLWSYASPVLAAYSTAMVAAVYLETRTWPRTDRAPAALI
jgi:hypothetical protein